MPLLPIRRVALVAGCVTLVIAAVFLTRSVRWSRLTGQVTTKCIIAAGTRHSDFAFSNDGTKLYAGSLTSGDLSVISTFTNERITSINVGTETQDIAMSPDGTKAYVAHDNQITVVDTASNTAVNILFVGFGAKKVLFTPDGSKAYVLLRDDSRVAIINTANYAITHVSIDENPLSFHKRIGMVMTPDGSKVFVLSSHDRPIAVISTQSDTVTATIPVYSDETSDIVITPDGTKAYVLNRGIGRIIVLSTASNSVMTSIEVDPDVIAFSPDSTKAYVTQITSAYREVKVIRTATHEVSATIALSHIPSSLAVSADGGKLYIGAFPGIYIVNTGLNTISKTIETTFSGPLAITPDGSKMYVGSVEGTSDGIVIVNLQTETLFASCAGSSSSAVSSVIPPPSSSSSSLSFASSSFATRCGDSRISGSEICERCPNYPTASIPSRMVTGDFNNDGKKDVAAQGSAANSRDIPFLTTYFGNGDGTFHSRQDMALPAGTSPSMAVGDFNRDGKDDIAISGGILRGNGDGTFTVQAVESLYYPTVSADLNGDGYDDVLTLQPTSTTLFLGGANGTLTAGLTFSTGQSGDPKRGQIGGIAVMDLDQDGRKDIVFNVAAYNSNPSYIRLLFGRGNGTFDAPVDIDSEEGRNGAHVLAGDVNEDNKPDVAIEYQSQVTVFLNQGNRVFTRRPMQGIVGGGVPGSQARGASIADMNGDGKLDIVWSSGVPVLGTTVYAGVFLGNGDGTFTMDAARTIRFPYEIDEGLAIDQFNADTLPDIVAPHWPVSSPTSGDRSFTIAINGGQHPSELCSACPAGQACNAATCQQCVAAQVSSSRSSSLTSSTAVSSSRSSSASIIPSSAASSPSSSSSASSAALAQCGNGMLQGVEQCEAGIPCATGFLCMECLCIPQTASSSMSIAQLPSSSSSQGGGGVCGNGVLDDLEQCDRAADFCPEGFACDDASCLCMPETEFPSASSASSILVASGPLCGNGILEGPEQCDTEIPCSGNGLCTADCMCQFPEMPSPDEPVVPSRCGDGILSAGEQCDSGIPCPNQGFCTSTCACKERSVMVPLCGNGVLNAREECDDGNTIDGDGCDAHCGREETLPVIQCGDGRIEGDEQCERSIPCPGTNDLCRNCQCLAIAVPVCGNGTIESDEACETTVPCADPSFLCASCRCIPPVCGDGSKAPSEECDDGNTLDDDGCSAACTREIPTVVASEQLCGNGIVEQGEDCDDGNRRDFDGCSASCARETPTQESLNLSLITEESPVTVTVTAPSTPVPPPTPVAGPTPKKAPSSALSVPTPPLRPVAASSVAPVPSFPVAAQTTLQVAQYPAYWQSVPSLPYAPPSGPAGATGPASAALMAAGAAAGFAFMRRKRK